MNKTILASAIALALGISAPAFATNYDGGGWHKKDPAKSVTNTQHRNSGAMAGLNSTAFSLDAQLYSTHKTSTATTNLNGTVSGNHVSGIGNNGGGALSLGLGGHGGDGGGASAGATSGNVHGANGGNGGTGGEGEGFAGTGSALGASGGMAGAGAGTGSNYAGDGGNRRGGAHSNASSGGGLPPIMTFNDKKDPGGHGGSRNTAGNATAYGQAGAGGNTGNTGGSSATASTGNGGSNTTGNANARGNGGGGGGGGMGGNAMSGQALASVTTGNGAAGGFGSMAVGGGAGIFNASNTISGSSLSHSAGITTVSQNTGANALVQQGVTVQANLHQ